MAQRKRIRQEGTPIEARVRLPHTGASSPKGYGKKLEIVLKCDFAGSIEALKSTLATIQVPEIDIRVIHDGVGSVSKSDLIMAMTGSRLVVGFNVDVMPGTENLAREYSVEVRLYNVIYRVKEELERIARSMIVPEAEEKVTGSAKVIRLFKSSRKGVILGCEVLEGTLAVGKNFRIISAMGPIYTSKIESLHIEDDTVKEAKAGQQVGVKISGFTKARLGDLIECFEVVRPKGGVSWTPRTGVHRLYS